MAPGCFRFGPFLLDADDRRLTRDGAPVELNTRYLDALALLVRERGKLVSAADDPRGPNPGLFGLAMGKHGAFKQIQGQARVQMRGQPKLWCACANACISNPVIPGKRMWRTK